jgi:hypothetical protein
MSKKLLQLPALFSLSGALITPEDSGRQSGTKPPSNDCVTGGPSNDCGSGTGTDNCCHNGAND